MVWHFSQEQARRRMCCQRCMVAGKGVPGKILLARFWKNQSLAGSS